MRALFLSIIALALTIQTAVAGVCNLSIDQIAAQLENRYGEFPIWAGVRNDPTVIITIFASRAGGTWSIVSSDPDGGSCLLGDGSNWITPDPQLPGEDG